jgi:hypothetical protein
MHNVDLFDAAECRKPEYDPDAWIEPETFEVAVRVCKLCPIRLRCLDYATDPQHATFTEHGVWGGRDANWRSRMRNQRRRNLRAGDRYQVVTFPVTTSAEVVPGFSL